MKALFKLLKKYPAVQAIEVANSKVVANDNTEEALLLAASFLDKPQKIIVVKNNLYAAQKLYERLENLLPSEKCLFFPVDESFRIEALATSPELLTQRIYVLDKMLNSDSYIVITHTAAIVRLLPSKDLFKRGKIRLQIDSDIKPDVLVEHLISIGYDKVNKIEHSLQFARRGGIIDIYSVNNDNPIRLEFFGDTIESIRYFDLDSQRTIKTVKGIEIIPATDLIVESDKYQRNLEKIKNSFLLKGDKYVSHGREIDSLEEQNSYSIIYKYYSQLNDDIGCLFDYMEDGLVIYSHEQDIRNNFNLLQRETFQYLEETEDTGFVLHYDLNHILDKPKNVSIIEMFRSGSKDVEFPLRSIEKGGGNAKRIKLIVEEYLRRKYHVVFCLENPKQISCVADWIAEWDYSFEYLDKDKLPKASLTYMEVGLKEGFELPDQKLVFLSAYELFGIQSKSNSNYTRFKEGIVLESYDNLEVGDYVVHEVYGIGQFLAIKTLENQGVHRDYLYISYRGNDVLYLPLDQFKLIRKYVSKQGVAPRLSKLGSKEWEKTKARIKNRIEDITENLVNLYIKRTKAVGFAFAPDDEWQYQFENSFPYELTKDQKKSIEEIKKDMEQPYPMDRLLCGDVGFGKTEVAFVAAFKAIMSGKQVAMLCPTTLLARQHYQVALERFQNFPINIGILSRMVSKEEQNAYLKALKKGEINLLIGTHRMLSSDVEFKDLGLLIVDEEQRFGVEHKEKIKSLKENVDVLTLSATPIPRTLQSALFGIRSLSQIETPPKNRMPIQTYVLEKSEPLIKEIIERELARNGQVFYLHNRVEDINILAHKIQHMVPNAKIIIIHGKMSKEQIEDAMIDFSNGEANVMICTTIIENGIDIPSANTIIIENADRFGLSQLYQIKGRVGRGDRLAYAYLFYNGEKELSEVANKRLAAIKEFAELGSGYRIALRDLTIRGAGDILGVEQAGFIDSIGIDMYLHLLEEAIAEKRDGIKKQEEVRRNDYHVDAYLPEHFTEDDMDKIDIYKKIGEAKTLEKLNSLQQEMVDVYGKLPNSVRLLLEKQRFEILSQDNLVEEVKDLTGSYELVLSEEMTNYDGIGVDIFRMCDELSRKIIVTYRGNRIRIRLDKNDSMWLDYCNTILKQLLELSEKYKKEAS